MRNLQELCRSRILNHMVGRVRAVIGAAPRKDGGDYIAMMVDDRSLRILSSCCKVYDVLEEGVTVVEHVMRKRQALPQLDSIYFLSPSISSIDALCKDFAVEKTPQYKSVHLFMTRPLGSSEEEIMKLMAQYPGLLSRLQTFVEFNLDMISYERRVFHFDDPYCLANLVQFDEANTLHSYLDRVADQLITVCATFGDKPEIRFQTNNFRWNEQLASLVHEKLNKLEFPGMTKDKSILLVVDRSVDLAAVLVHEYTYQAAIYDLLNVPVCTPSNELDNKDTGEGNGTTNADDAISYPVLTNDGRQERRVALLNEDDEVFVRYRHHHLMTALRRVPQEIQKFVAENGAAKLKMHQQRRDLTNEELQKAIRDLPEFQEMLAKFTLHHTVSQRCILEMNRLGLPKAGPLEQDLATGVDSSGKELSSKKILSSLGTVLCSAALGSEEKLRLLLLYFSMTDGVKEDDRRKITEVAQLPLEYQQIVQYFTSLKLSQATVDISVAPPPQHTHKLANDKERRQYFIQRAKSVDVALSRFQPLIKDLMHRLLANTLHQGRFPLIAAPEARRGGLFSDDALLGQSSKDAEGCHVRARDRDWDFGGDDLYQETSSSAVPGGGTRFSQQQQPVDNFGDIAVLRDIAQPAIIIFILGGITMSEIRSCYEVTKQTGVECFVGGSTIVTPKNFIAMLKKMANAKGISRTASPNLIFNSQVQQF